MNINNIINVSISSAGTVAYADNINSCMVITSNTDFLSSNKRYASYIDASSVEQDFGTFSDVYKKAQVFFSQNKNPISVNSKFHIGYWRAGAETVPATAGVLKSSALVADTVVSQLQSVSNGSFDIDIDTTTYNIAGLDFTSSVDMFDIANVIQTEIQVQTTSTETVVWDGTRLTITSATTGVGSDVSFTTVNGGGTDISSILSLDSGSGATSVTGVASVINPAETKLECLAELSNQVGFRAFSFIDAVNDVEAVDIAQWATTEEKLYYQVFSDTTSHLAISTTNPCWDIKIKGYKYARCLFSKANDRGLAIAYMSRAHSVNFGGSNVAATMNLKELVSVTPEDYTTTQELAMERIGIDFYTTIKNAGRIISNGANGYWDDIYNQTSLKLDVQIDAYNTLANVDTKIAQTDEGVEVIKDTIVETLERYNTAGVIAGGSWTNASTFGNREQLLSSVLSRGYYVYSDSVNNMSVTARANREAPLIQTAVKFAGAIHSVDIVLNINL
ncbi:DUF3383 family protein [Francisella marina]|uniref:DUF3383 domain-containing protein n=1 Tax=Francisella marina TaxID=2249302 RepID=A0ABX5ZGS7_9GAMM|nr:DUF3383 family protein [Francisella marina]QEO57562.1 DUF3383 domain-containing protein [Francisella marina]